MLVPLVPTWQGREVESSGARRGGQFHQNYNYFCYSVLRVHCFISANNATMKLKGSDSESSLFSVKENNQTWTGGSGTAGRRRR